MRYRRLTLVHRYQIQAFLQSNLGVRDIARELKVSASTISREIDGRGLTYCALKAYEIGLQKTARRRVGKFKISGALKDFVEEKIGLDWSPQQICESSKFEAKFISTQSIYRHIERDKTSGGKLWTHLRILRKQRKDRKAASWRPNWSTISQRVDIIERPSVVNERTRLGDFERDLVLGKLNGPSLLTIVDRRSRLVKIVRIEHKNAEDVHWATVEALKNETVHTITNDNGTEFANHYFTKKDLGCEVYFSRAYRAWERGTNENMNGLLRQYFPKKKCLAHVTPERIKEVENLLNTRPRKCLGYKTPLEVHSSG